MNKKQKIKDFDPIESKKRNKKDQDMKFDPSRKNKKFYLNKSYHEYV